jgi:hypothetical protein
MWCALHQVGSEFSAGQFLGLNVVRQHRLSSLAGEDDCRQLTNADPLPRPQYLNVLQILYVYRVGRNGLVCQVSAEARLELGPLRP